MAWQTLSSTTDYQNPHMRILKDEVVQPNSQTKTYYTLDRGGPFSIIIPLLNYHTTYLVGQYRYTAKYYSWEFPMGRVKNKSPLAMAKIELQQETGITAKTWHPIGRFFVANGHSSEDAYVFVAQDLTLGKNQPEPDEFLEVKQVTFSQVAAMIHEGKILDGPTITAFYFFTQSSLYASSTT